LQQRRTQAARTHRLIACLLEPGEHAFVKEGR
jgi:hypothetical protein